jgi:Ca2+-binding EF-hand superfamily protein
MRKLTLALSTAALTLAGAATAQTSPTPGAPAKARAPMADMTRAEAQTRAEAAFQRMDANQDGTLDQADRQARHAQMFDRIDADRNGSISRAEFDAMHAKRAERRADKPAAGKRMERRRAMSDAAGPITRQAFVNRALGMFDRADANRDGTVTVAERRAAREALRGQWRARAAERQQG